MRSVIVIIICLATTTIFSACNFETRNESQYRTVQLSLEGKKYDNLHLFAGTIHRGLPALIHGTTTNGYHWTFVVSDSIAKIARHFMIRSENEDDIHRITFQTIINGDTLRSENFNFDKNERIIELTGTFDASIRRGNATQLTDYFTIPLPQNTFLRESMQTPMFSYFFDRNNPNKSYEEFLTKYANLIRGNPNSLYFMTSIFMTPRFYRSKEDIEPLFNLFSPEMQNSIWGEAVRRIFTSPNFDGINDIVLQNSLTKEYEKIILDPTKYTLLCISASWCGPCIRAIPRLKEIHEATKGRLNLVYISTDDRTTIADWNALMERENIAWRSLWLTDRNLGRRWGIGGIPAYILVAPNGNAKKIRLRTEEEIQELFSILGM